MALEATKAARTGKTDFLQAIFHESDHNEVAANFQKIAAACELTSDVKISCAASQSECEKGAAPVYMGGAKHIDAAAVGAPASHIGPARVKICPGPLKVVRHVEVPIPVV